jgi:hypothetical protein
MHQKNRTEGMLGIIMRCLNLEDAGFRGRGVEG